MSGRESHDFSRGRDVKTPLQEGLDDHLDDHLDDLVEIDNFSITVRGSLLEGATTPGSQLRRTSSSTWRDRLEPFGVAGRNGLG
jgi:hypothetical protein